ncbi:MAG: hypothetical protein FH758_14810 [Firmicutes bacterium]|nr:hypothetical protein [Bacillota bacterium]
MIDALVLAGSPNDGQLKEYSAAKFEALIPVGKQTMVEYVVKALLHSERIRKVAVVGPSQIAKLFPEQDIIVVPPQSNIATNIYQGLQYLPDAHRVLVATSDIPLITHLAVDEFIKACGNCERDIYFPVVPKDLVKRKFPQAQRTYVKLKKGTFTGGNIFLINPDIVPRCLNLGQQLIDMRKSPARLCKMLGFVFLLKFITRQLTLEQVERKASSLLGVNGQAVVCRFPEVGVDIDKPSDLTLILDIMDISS